MTARERAISLFADARRSFDDVTIDAVAAAITSAQRDERERAASACEDASTVGDFYARRIRALSDEGTTP